MNTNSLKKGFTLIELLVVVAIIGILATIVLSKLSKAQALASDAVVKETIHNMRTQAELYAEDHNGKYGTQPYENYGGPTCDRGMYLDPKIVALVADLRKNIGYPKIIDCRIGSNGLTWRIEIQNFRGTNQRYCADSTGLASTNYTADILPPYDGMCDPMP